MAAGATGQRVATLAVLGALYLGQGVVAGFAGFILIPTLAAADVSLEAQTGLLALAGLPWVLKLLWAPLLDRFGARDGGRPRWILAAAMLGIAATLAWLGHSLPRGEALVDGIGRLQAQWLLLSALLSLQDVSTDALALDRVRARDRGLANGVMLGAAHVGRDGLGGMALGAAVVASGLGWGMTLLAIGFAMTAAAPLLLAASPPTESDARARPGFFTAVRTALSSKRGRFVAGLCAVVMFADVVTGSVSGAFWVQRLHWSTADITAVLPPLLLLSGVIGHALAAWTVDRLGHAGATALGAAALGGCWIAFGLAEPLWTTGWFLPGFVVVQGVATAVMSVGVHALAMDATQPAIRATHFAVLMALLNLPRVVAPTLAPALLGMLGFAGLFVACGVLQLAVGVVARRGRAGR